MKIPAGKNKLERGTSREPSAGKLSQSAFLPAGREGFAAELAENELGFEQARNLAGQCQLMDTLAELENSIYLSCQLAAAEQADLFYREQAQELAAEACQAAGLKYCETQASFASFAGGLIAAGLERICRYQQEEKAKYILATFQAKTERLKKGVLAAGKTAALAELLEILAQDTGIYRLAVGPFCADALLQESLAAVVAAFVQSRLEAADYPEACQAVTWAQPYLEPEQLSPLLKLVGAKEVNCAAENGRQTLPAKQGKSLRRVSKRKKLRARW